MLKLSHSLPEDRVFPIPKLVISNLELLVIMKVITVVDIKPSFR